MATSINNTNTNVTTNINAITSINTVITDLSATMATSIDNRTAAITSINTVVILQYFHFLQAQQVSKGKVFEIGM